MNEKIAKLQNTYRVMNKNSSNDLKIELKVELLEVDVDELSSEEYLAYLINVVEAEIPLAKTECFKLMRLLIKLRTREKYILNQGIK